MINRQYIVWWRLQEQSKRLCGLFVICSFNRAVMRLSLLGSTFYKTHTFPLNLWVSHSCMKWEEQLRRTALCFCLNTDSDCQVLGLHQHASHVSWASGQHHCRQTKLKFMPDVCWWEVRSSMVCIVVRQCSLSHPPRASSSWSCQHPPATAVHWVIQALLHRNGLWWLKWRF